MINTEQKERPILFSAEMVRALLDGRKTQTRRIVKLDSPTYPTVTPKTIKQVPHSATSIARDIRCPYGKPGDVLWVREALKLGANGGIIYVADGEPVIGWEKHFGDNPARPSVSPIHMPRWASRLSLRITNVRVQQLCVITEQDAQAEGMLFLGGMADDFDMAPWADPGDPKQEAYVGARGAFTYAWDRINGRGSWPKNPWVWAVSFERMTEGGVA